MIPYFIRAGKIILWVALIVWAYFYLLKPLSAVFDKDMPIEHSKNIADLIKAIAWPVVIGLALIAHGKPLLKFLEGLGQRITKLSIFDIGIELATVSEFKPSWSIGSVDVRKITHHSVMTDNVTLNLFEQITENNASDYAIADLGFGKEWLTSRLFIFAVMLERLSGLKCFVFLETAKNADKRFIGAALPANIRWALARQYPWLEAAFIESYSRVIIPNKALPPSKPDLPAEQFISSETGAIDMDKARNLVATYLDLIQISAPLIPSESSRWVPLGEPPTLWERAEWIDGSRLKKDLCGVLFDCYVADSPFTPSDKRVEAILRCESPFVALLRKGNRFSDLVDRQAMLEAVAVQAVAASREHQN